MECEAARVLQNEARVQGRRRRKQFLARLLAWFVATVGVWVLLTWCFVRGGAWLDNRDAWNRNEGYLKGWAEAEKLYVPNLHEFGREEVTPQPSSPNNPFLDLKN